MYKSIKLFVILFTIFAVSACTRIETGEVGLRIGWNKEVNMQELLPGSFNQTIIGEVVTLPVREISVKINNLRPQTKDNSILDDFDLMLVYSISPDKVAELYTTKSKGFNSIDDDGRILLMYNYVSNTVASAINKAVRKHKVLELADNRVTMETDIMEMVKQTFVNEGLNDSIAVSLVQVISNTPSQTVIASANEAVKANNDLAIKIIQVDIAEKEKERLNKLKEGITPETIGYMNAQANATIAEAVKDGKIQTILIPHTLGGINLQTK